MSICPPFRADPSFICALGRPCALYWISWQQQQHNNNSRTCLSRMEQIRQLKRSRTAKRKTSESEAGGSGAADAQCDFGDHHIASVEHLHERFRNMYIHIKTVTIAEFPYLVQVHKSTSEDADDSNMACTEYRVMTRGGGTIPYDYKQKWMKLENPCNEEKNEKARKLQLFLNLFSLADKKLVYDYDSSSWDHINESKMDMEGVDLLDGLIDKKFKGNESSVHETQHLIKKLETFLDKERAGDEMFVESMVANAKLAVMGIRDKYELFLMNDLRNTLLCAMLHKMHKSKGRAFVERLFASASYVCFGDAYDMKYISCMGVGTSVCHKEGFPVVSSKATQHDLAPWTSKRPKRDPPTTGETEEGILKYPDCVVVCNTEKPAYLAVAEVTSGYSGEKEELQLWQGMIGAGMHQNEVFGLLIAHNQAKVYRLCFDHKQKIIEYSSHEYVYPVLSELKRLFTDLIAVLDYANNKITEQM